MEATGVWADEVERIRLASIVGGRVDDAGNLVLENGAGAEFNAGKVVVPLAAWPVYSIFVHTTPTNPADLLGGGTWERYGKGRVLVSQNSADPEFVTAGDVGGAKGVALTHPNQNAPHVHPINDPMHGHGDGGVWKGIGGAAGEARFVGEGSTLPSPTNITIEPSGGGMEHLNLQPYIVVYMWRRTA